MPVFSELKSWELDTAGNVKLQLASPDGRFYDATFNRSVIPAILVVLNRFFMNSSQQFPEGLRELLVAQVPMSTAAVSLPGGEYALSIGTQSGTTHHFPFVPGSLEIFSKALAELAAILSAEAQALQAHTKQ